MYSVESVRSVNRPLAVNALFAIDDFREDNGATVIIPGSHKWDFKRACTN